MPLADIRREIVGPKMIRQNLETRSKVIWHPLGIFHH